MLSAQFVVTSRRTFVFGAPTILYAVKLQLLIGGGLVAVEPNRRVVNDHNPCATLTANSIDAIGRSIDATGRALSQFKDWRAEVAIALFAFIAVGVIVVIVVQQVGEGVMDAMHGILIALAFGAGIGAVVLIAWKALGNIGGSNGEGIEKDDDDDRNGSGSDP